MQGTQVRSLVQEDSTCFGATKDLAPPLLSPRAPQSGLIPAPTSSGRKWPLRCLFSAALRHHAALGFFVYPENIELLGTPENPLHRSY